MSSSHETACHVITYLNVELKLALVAIQKCLVLLHDYLGPNTKKQWLQYIYILEKLFSHSYPGLFAASDDSTTFK